MKEYSKDWQIDESSNRIFHKDGKFYAIMENKAYGNPVVLQPAGNVYLTLVNGLILCEQETVYEDEKGEIPTKQWRAARASIHNPDQPVLNGEPVFLGEGHSNTQRIFGAPDKFWLVELAENPNPEKYRLLSWSELAAGKDNFGCTAYLKYLLYMQR